MLRRGALVLACVLGADVAAAQSTTVARNGAWEAYVAISQDRTPLCGMLVIGDQQRSLHVKWFKGSNLLTLQAFKRSWAIPAGTRMPIMMRVDNHEGWQAPQALGGGTMVQWSVTQETFREFALLFKAGTRMTVSFPNGSEAPWSISLSGSSATFNAFASCIVGMMEASTQPHGGR